VRLRRFLFKIDGAREFRAVPDDEARSDPGGRGKPGAKPDQ
jgi:hypothetical protein